MEADQSFNNKEESGSKLNVFNFWPQYLTVEGSGISKVLKGVNRIRINVTNNAVMVSFSKNRGVVLPSYLVENLRYF